MVVYDLCSKRTSSFKSTFSSSAIFIKFAKSGWHVFVHHLETVPWSLPNCSANHLFVIFFSARTTFSRLRSLFSIIFFFYWAKGIKNIENDGYSFQKMLLYPKILRLFQCFVIWIDIYGNPNYGYNWRHFKSLCIIETLWYCVTKEGRLEQNVYADMKKALASNL